MPDRATPTEAKVIDLACARFQCGDRALQAEDDLFESLGINSYRAMELLTELEEHFSIEVPDYELQDVRTFRQLAAVIEKRL